MIWRRTRRQKQQLPRRRAVNTAPKNPRATPHEPPKKPTPTPRPTLEWADQALRTLSAATARENRYLPELDGAFLSETGLELVLAVGSQLAGPFHVDDQDQRRWRCPLNATLLDPGDAEQVPAPYPALTPLGDTGDGRTVLADLESWGVTQIVSGSRHAHQILLRHLAASLAAAPWAEHVMVLAVGMELPADETEPTTPRHRWQEVKTMDEVLDQLRIRAQSVGQQLTRAGADDVRAARVQETAPDTWPPQVVLASEPLNISHLDALSEQVRAFEGAPVAIVAPLSVDAGTSPSRIELDPQGRVHMSRLPNGGTRFPAS